MRRIGSNSMGLIAEVEEDAAEPVRTLFRSKSGIHSEERLESLILDADGSVVEGEPWVEVSVRGVLFELRLRHAPYLRRELASKGELNDLPGFKGITRLGAFMTIISRVTAAALEAALDSLIRERARELAELEAKVSGVREILRADARWLSYPHCAFCGFLGALIPYAECCGRPVKQN